MTDAINDEMVIEIPNYEEEIEELNKPAIDEGDYLAVVTGAVMHDSKATPGNISIKWSLTINLGAYDDGWDFDARALPLFPDYYTPLFNTVDGKKKLGRGYGITDKMARAMGCITDGTIDLSGVTGGLVLVTVKHEEDNRQTPEDVKEEGQRWSARVQRVSPYKDEDGVLAPKLAGYADEDEDVSDGDTEF